LRSIAAAFTDRNNRFTPIRLGLASAVMIEHAVIVTQGPAPSAPMAINTWSLSYAAVNAFFILSGFLIANSLEHRRDPFTYAASRFARLMPALVLLSVVAVFGVGPFVTALDPAAYWTSLQTWTFPFQVLAFLDTSQGPAGIFSTNPWAGEFSAPLWTLRYEVIAYVVAALLFFTPLPWSRGAVLVYLIAGSAFYMALKYLWPEAPGLILASARLGSAFLIGMAVYLWRDRLPVAAWIGLAALPVWLALGASAPAELAMNVMIASILFWIAFGRLGLPTGGALPDWSYGIYIWHYPVMQIVVHANPSASPWLVFALAAPVTAGIAALSWRFVEKPALGQKTRIGQALRAIPRLMKLASRPSG
jgi:peptidoglycan/LPS O-acetylase OafA/YrhL